MLHTYRVYQNLRRLSPSAKHILYSLNDINNQDYSFNKRLQLCRIGWATKENFWRLPYILHFDIKMENVAGLERTRVHGQSS